MSHISDIFFERADPMSTSTNAANKRRKLRYDRIIIAAIFLIILIIILYIIFNTAFGTKNKKEDDLNAAETQNSLSSTLLTSNGRIEFEKIFLNNDDIHKGSLILVNDNHEYISQENGSSGFISVDKMKNDYYKLKNSNITMDETAAKSFNSMLSGFYLDKSDKSIILISAFVSKDQQDIMYNQALENSLSVSKGGFSEHQTGLAADIGSISDSGKLTYLTPDEKYSWFAENCSKYGFIQRYPDDKNDATGVNGHEYHFRYVGIPHAYYMKENNLTLEEYLEVLKKYTFGGKSLSFPCYSKQYEIYYIKAKSDINDVYVPRTNSYTVSGNNIDGFIVTVEK